MKIMIFAILVSLVLMFGCVDSGSAVQEKTDGDETVSDGQKTVDDAGADTQEDGRDRDIEVVEEDRTDDTEADEVQVEEKEGDEGIVDDEQDPAGIANPASVYCEKRGGVLTLEGSRGMCELPDGDVCEEWAYFRGECPDWNTDDMSAKCKPLHIPEPDWADTVNAYAARYGYGYDHAAFMLEKEYLKTQKISVHEEYCNSPQYKIETDGDGCKICVKR